MQLNLEIRSASRQQEYLTLAHISCQRVCVCLHNSLEPLYITAAGERPRAKVLSVNGNRQS